MTSQTSGFPFLNMRDKLKQGPYENMRPKIHSQKLIDTTSKPRKITKIDIQNLSPKSKQKEKEVTNIVVEKKEGHTKERTEDEIANEEYVLSLKKSLDEAFDVNDELRRVINQLHDENKMLRKDLEEKENALVELANYYEYCKEHHKEKTEEDDITEGKNNQERKNSC